MSNLAVISALSLVVQFIVERLKAPIPDRMRVWAVPVLVMVVSLLLSLCCSIGFLANFGINIQPVWLDYLITGFIVSGGSTLTNEIIKVLQGLKDVTQQSINK